jgi:putative transposase
MARIARVVVPDYPHHVIHRGNRRERVFFDDHDRRAYLAYLREQAKRTGIEFWAYCLMDNHVHFIAVPKKEDSFARGFAQAHKLYTRRINFKQEWRGHLWEGRFKSCVLSEPHLYAAIRYVERNPVRAGIAKKAWDYPWSSASAHVFGKKDNLLSNNFVPDIITDWKNYLLDDRDDKNSRLFTSNADTGRPVGDESFIEKLEAITGRILRRNKPGPRRMGN